MPVFCASIYGGASGLLTGFGIAMFHDISLPNMLFRLFVLVVGGAILGGLMAWLDDILTPLKRGDGAYRKAESKH